MPSEICKSNAIVLKRNCEVSKILSWLIHFFENEIMRTFLRFPNLFESFQENSGSRWELKIHRWQSCHLSKKKLAKSKRHNFSCLSFGQKTRETKAVKYFAFVIRQKNLPNRCGENISVIIIHSRKDEKLLKIDLSFLSNGHEASKVAFSRVHTSSSILENSTRSKTFFDTRSLLEYQFYVRVLLELDSKFFEKLASTRNVLWIVDRWRNVIFSHKILKCLLFWDIILILQSCAIVWDYC